MLSLTSWMVSSTIIDAYDGRNSTTVYSDYSNDAFPTGGCQMTEIPLDELCVYGMDHLDLIQ